LVIYRADSDPFEYKSTTTDSFAQGLLITKYYQTWNDSAWEPNFKISYNYNSTDSLISKISYDWNVSSWEFENKYTATLNSQNLHDTISYSTWNGTAWENDSMITLTYTGNHIDSRRIMYNPGFTNGFQYDYHPDGSGYDTLINVQIFDSVWSPLTQFQRQYDVTGNVTRQQRNSFNGSWNNLFLDSLFYTNTHLNEMVSYQWNNSTSWEPFERIVYLDSAGLDTSIIEYFYDTISVSWQPELRHLKVFNNFGSVTYQEEGVWNISDFYPQFWADFSYDTLGRLINYSSDCVGCGDNYFSFQYYAQGLVSYSSISSSTFSGSFSQNTKRYFYYLTFPVSDSIYVYTSLDFRMCVDDSSTLNSFIIGGYPPYSIQWSPSIALNNDTLLAPVTSTDTTINYTITVTDSMMNTAIDNVTIDIFEADFDLFHTSCIGCNDGSILITANNYYSISISPPSGTVGDSTITDLPAGTYNVCANGYCTVCEVITILDDPTSISDIKNDYYKIYPNPSNGNFMIIFGDDIPPGGTLFIRNIHSQAVRKLEIEQRVIQVENINPGVYFIEYRNNDLYSFSKIIVSE
jgi:hypothetical protein